MSPEEGNLVIFFQVDFRIVMGQGLFSASLSPLVSKNVQTHGPVLVPPLCVPCVGTENFSIWFCKAIAPE